MAGGPWNILDQIGAIVGAARNGLNDADYLALIRIQARVNRARGTPEDVMGLATLMAAPLPATYLEFYPAAFYIGAFNIALNYPIIVPLLKQVRPAGVYGLFAYSTWPAGNDFAPGSIYDAKAGEGGLGSIYDTTAGGGLVACVAL